MTGAASLPAGALCVLVMLARMRACKAPCSVPSPTTPGSLSLLPMPWPNTPPCHSSFPRPQHLDLSGQREFLTAKAAEDALAPMLEGAQPITKVRGPARPGWQAAAVPTLPAPSPASRAGPGERMCSTWATLAHFSPPPSTPAAQIKFSTKSFGDEAAAVAAKAIERMADSLTHADMADIIAGRPGAQAVRGQTECEFCRCRLDREGGPAPSRCWAVFELQTVPCPALGRHELGGISHSPANFPRSPNPRSRRPMPQRRRRCERCGPSPPRSPRPPWWSWTCPTTRWARRASEPRPPPLSAR